ncbi:non-ribosomal peptide synthetase module [Paenibacillus sp. 1001270B_150601_E10]|uniref:non-ribosomal peptide synthetase module n=1 Tax=Paenibacillus sp. 1001270B_150601_E10 TaxID=2787079 RepID=UPI00189D3107|nr:non-ribosomal peptide synthetase module [Paenibacillus sp. 1001270B_150601_E10]
MARRLATEYVKARMQLTESQLPHLLQSFLGQSIVWHVKVLENGSQEVVLEDGQGDEVTFLFEKQGNRYVCVTSCRLERPKLTQVMQKLVATFRGEAVVNRIFAGFTMTYYYVEGTVQRIVQHQGGENRLIYERKDQNKVKELAQLFHQDNVERKIAELKRQINKWLDARNLASDKDSVQAIDEQLNQLVHQLFVLEAY